MGNKYKCISKPLAGGKFSICGTYCTTMVHTAQQWYTLHNNGTYCTTMVHTAQQGYILHNNGTYCTTMVHTTQQWYTLHNNGTCCTTMVRTAQQWFFDRCLRILPFNFLNLYLSFKSLFVFVSIIYNAIYKR